MNYLTYSSGDFSRRVTPHFIHEATEVAVTEYQKTKKRAQKMFGA